jgi:(E)-4-hydroxy-3-methylbut-2-enyl-diphosphate synthase
MFQRRATRTVIVGDKKIGSECPVSIQSMCSTFTTDVAATLKQCHALLDAGVELIRITVPDRKSAAAFGEIRRELPKIPLIADIHFLPDMAFLALEQGADCIRINPGNIGSKAKVGAIVKAVKEAKKAMRIGVNSGSLEKEIETRHGGPTPGAIVESARHWCEFLEEQGFGNFKVSLKSSSVPHALEAYRLFARDPTCGDYPLHLGITEAGNGFDAVVKSSVGLGILLLEGLGDTIRISLTQDPVDEVISCRKLLEATRQLTPLVYT